MKFKETGDPDSLDESIRDKARRTGEKVKIPAAPFETKVKIHQESDGVLVEIPPTGIIPLAYAKLPLQLVFMATIVAWFLLPITKITGRCSDNIFFIGFVGLGLLLMLASMLGFILTQARGSALINASRHILRIVEKTPFRKKTIEIPADELEAIGKKERTPEGFTKTPDGRPMIDKSQYGTH